MNAPTQAVIFCGGLGTRLMPLTEQIPKPLAPVLGRPFLDYLVEQLRDEGIERILLLTGYRGEQIAEHYGCGEDFGVAIQCVQTPAEWETGVRLADAKELLDERFLLLYSDNLAPFRLAPLWQRHQALGLPVTATLVAKDKGNIRLRGDGSIDAYDSTRAAAGLTHVEIGYMIVERDAVMEMDPGRGSFSVVLRELAAANRLGAFEPGCSYHSISDLGRLRKLEDFLRPRRLLLLDRDGLINRKAARGEYIWRKEDFVWIPETVAALECLAREGFEFIILSNQAGIGRGVVEARAVDNLHAWMCEQLRGRGVNIIDIFVCPHHWEDKCACRKPRPGLFFAASKRHGFCLERTAYVGDDPRDVEAAWNATCPCVLVGPESWPGGKEPIHPHYQAAEMGQAVPWIVNRFRGWETTPPLAKSMS